MSTKSKTALEGSKRKSSTALTPQNSPKKGIVTRFRKTGPMLATIVSSGLLEDIENELPTDHTPKASFSELNDEEELQNDPVAGELCEQMEALTLGTVCCCHNELPGAVCRWFCYTKTEKEFKTSRATVCGLEVVQEACRRKQEMQLLPRFLGENDEHCCPPKALR